MSYKEKSIGLSMFITSYILYYYITGVYDLSVNNLLSGETQMTLIRSAIILVIILEVISQTIIAIIDHKQADQKDDERDTSINLIASRNAYIILTIGIVTAIFHAQIMEFATVEVGFSELSNGYNLLNIIISSFLVAEIIKYSTQLYYYRRGF
jgi:hypothetical protein